MSFIDEVRLTPAAVEDIDIVLDTIIEAEKSGTNIISSCLIFNITEQEYRKVLTSLLMEEYEDYEFALSGFLVAKHNDKKLGSLGSWIEGKNDTDSSIIKANVLFTTIERDKLLEVQPNLKNLRGASFHRTKGALQLEYAYVKPEFRRKGVFTKLILEQIKRYRDIDPELPMAESILFRENYRSLNCFQKLNFQLKDSIDLKGQPSEKFFPYSERILMQFHKHQYPD